MTDFLTAAEISRRDGDQQNAYRLLLAALDQEPRNADLWYHMGCALHDMRQYGSAVAAFARADQLRPNDHKILTDLALNLGGDRRFPEAHEIILRALDANPWAPIANIVASQILYAMSDLRPATEFAQRAVAADPMNPHAHLQLSFCLAAAGDGWTEYEWRFYEKIPEFLKYPYPLWRGEPVDTLLIVAEQGLGDAIMMMRYVPAVVHKCSTRAIWMVHKELRRLAGEFVSFNAIPVEIIPLPAALPPADAFIPMMSCPVAVDANTYTPYIRSYSGVLDSPVLRVGIAWAGSPLHDNAKWRDIPLEEFLPLAEIPCIDLYSLQVGERRGDLDRLAAHALIRDLSGQITDLYDTAKIIADLDLVISCDTSVAHLVGAMGKEVWLLVDEGSRDWRWGKRTDKTAWYPSMTIFERRNGWPWADVFGLVANKLWERERQR